MIVMIKYYCDRCGAELPEYAYNHNSYSVYVIAADYGVDNDSYKICSYCYFDFKNFIKERKNGG